MKTKNRFIRRILKRWLVFVISALGWLSEILRFKKAYRILIARLVRRTGLFDEAYYLQNSPDVAADGFDPLMHYVAYGDKENRLPMPLFDPAHYRSNARRRCPKTFNALVHYTLVGRFEGYATSPWFDTAYYLFNNRDVKFNGQDPLRHFLQQGGIEGRSPSPMFDCTRYLRTHPQVAEEGVNPLLHHLGCTAEGRGRTHIDTDRPHPQADTPSVTEWAALPHKKDDLPPLVDVIVPVFRGKAETLRCIFNVLRYQQKTPFELIVINDASPEQELEAALEELAGQKRFTYIVNKSNIGFVRSVNKGMQLHSQRDVVLLNADTEPYNDWLDRLRQSAYRDARAATVTPLSNNATICSYPVFDRDNPNFLELPSVELDLLARTVNAGRTVEAPTAVGFCMYIKRQCLQEIGLYDQQSFGRGYGEENDFCQRAIRQGWKNLIAADIFVWHWGATSFKGRKGRRLEHAMRVMAKRFPHYRTDVSAFIAKDPLLPFRRRLDMARLTYQSSLHNILLVTHNRGGGTERFVKEIGTKLRLRGANLIFLSPNGGRHRGHLSSAQAPLLPNLKPVDFRNPHAFQKLLQQLEISRIHIHQLIDLDENAPVVIAQCAAALGLNLDIFVHDYQAICPRINLVGVGGLYCGEPSENICIRCLKEKIPGIRGHNCKDIRKWRRRYGLLYETANRVIVPDEDVARRLHRHFPRMRTLVRPHESLVVPKQNTVRRAMNPKDKLRIAIIGAIGTIKGFSILRECAKDAQKRKLPLEFRVMGYTQNDDVLIRHAVSVTGRYRESEANRILKSLEPNLVWLPSVWPETYSYTLSIALSLGLDVSAFDIGAIANRLRHANKGELLQPLQWANRPNKINNFFLRYRNKVIDWSRVEKTTVPPVQKLPEQMARQIIGEL